MKYLNENLTRESFLRLRQKKSGGKSGLERTTALLCFLAFDALLKRTGITPPIELDPDDNNGTNNRASLTREFARLAQLKSGRVPRQMLNLGEVTVGGSPEKRFSSNFLTVSLKKATTSDNVYNYPSRPANPLLVLGLKATQMKWGINRHKNWKENLPVFLAGRKTKTPFHDLACFVLRQRGFLTSASVLQEGLMDGLSEIFTPELCAFWKKQLNLEKIYAQKAPNPFQDIMPNPFGNCSWAGNMQPVNKISALTSRIKYLEGVLRLNRVSFEK